jgi:hypothetical protein
MLACPTLALRAHVKDLHDSRMRSGTPDIRLIERLRKTCLALPEANERISHGAPTWFAGRGKVFAMLDDHHHGAKHHVAKPLSVWLPLPLGLQDELIEYAPDRFFKPPYFGGRGWVGVVLDKNPDWPQCEGLIRDAYRHVATKTLQKRLTD